MKRGFYRKIAITGIGKNKKLYVPYILTCVGMVMMYYIISSLSLNPILDHVSGGGTAKSMLNFGSYIIAFFCVIFLFYTNSFLIRRRKKEFGLYNILGMDKKNIGIVLLWETIITAFISLLSGLFLGIALSKFAELLMVNLLKADVSYSFSISVKSVENSLIIFGLIFLLLYLNGLRQVHLTNPIELLHSENTGEKPPKGNILLGLGGILILGGAYYIAVTIKAPITALVFFFIAVIMVIAGTYMLFISSSVLLCRILQKSKRYYYNPNHFVTVAQMKYRMKRNGAGLASICILSTMVLVMITSTSCLYFGEEDALETRYPHDITTSLFFNLPSDMNDKNLDDIRDGFTKVIEKQGLNSYSLIDYRTASITGYMETDVMEVRIEAMENFSFDTYDKLVELYFMPLSDYNRVNGTDEKLAENEAMIYCVRRDYDYDSFTINDGMTLNIVKKLDEFKTSGYMSMDVLPSMVIVVPDFDKTLEPLALFEYNGLPMLQSRWECGIDSSADEEVIIDVYHEIIDDVAALVKEGGLNITHTNCESRAVSRDAMFGSLGGLFFLGIMLSLVFVTATVLIIYYKQISEGYEDQSRFEIMQKVGMTKKDIRKNINSQMFTVFFLPLGTAVMHLGFAFPVIRKLLLLFMLDNIKLFLATTGVSVLAFAMFYALVYKITGNSYYGIVSGGKE